MNKAAFTNEKEAVATKGLKLKNKPKELTEKQKQAQAQQRLDEAADGVVQDVQQRDADGAFILKRYIELLKSKTLPSNKGVVGKKIEQEIITQILELAITINNDPREDKDGMGTVPILNLLLKGLLMQKDRINELEYKSIQLEQKILELGKK